MVLEPLSEAPPLRSFTCSNTPLLEAREVARQVRDLADTGIALETIAVAANSADRRARLRDALERYGVAVSDRIAHSPLDASPVRIALELYTLVESQAPRERLIALISSRYLRGGIELDGKYLPPERLARALREAGVTDANGYAARLDSWRAGQRSERKTESDAIAARLAEWFALLDSLPAHANLATHVRAFGAALAHLELATRARGSRPGRVPPVAEARAIARDQLAMDELEALLGELPRLASRAGLTKTTLSRARFHRLLTESLAGIRCVRAVCAARRSSSPMFARWRAGRLRICCLRPDRW